MKLEDIKIGGLYVAQEQGRWRDKMLVYVDDVRWDGVVYCFYAGPDDVHDYETPDELLRLEDHNILREPTKEELKQLDDSIFDYFKCRMIFLRRAEQLPRIFIALGKISEELLNTEE